MPMPEPISTDLVPSPGPSRLRHVDEVKVLVKKVDVGVEEGDKPLPRRGPRPKRRRPTKNAGLKVTLLLIQQSDGKPSLVPKPAKERPLPDPGRRRDLVHGHVRHPVLPKQPPSCFQHLDPVTRSISPLTNGRGITGLRSAVVTHVIRTLVHLEHH